MRASENRFQLKYSEKKPNRTFLYSVIANLETIMMYYCFVTPLLLDYFMLDSVNLINSAQFILKNCKFLSKKKKTKKKNKKKTKNNQPTLNLLVKQMPLVQAI